jgi:choline dehydrogenase-like flavoprotein
LPTYFDECERRVKASIEARLPGAIVRVLRRYSGEQHWMGATRMANDPRQGCVDENLRYHGLENLWVLSASTFPSCSSANPTLTLSALALRLGDHLAAAPPAGP